jgi:coproporphyrinogen III oxidase-like Fe-S oxidoreductase
LEILTPEEALREDIMLALRTKRGARNSDIAAANLEAICEDLIAEGLLERAGDYYRCTNKGWFLGNLVFSAVWLG